MTVLREPDALDRFQPERLGTTCKRGICSVQQYSFAEEFTRSYGLVAVRETRLERAIPTSKRKKHLYASYISIGAGEFVLLLPLDASSRSPYLCKGLR